MGQSSGSNRNRPCTPTSLSDFETDPSNETIQNTDAEDLPVPDHPHLADNLCGSNMLQYFPLPSYLQHLAPNKQIVYNSGGSLVAAVAQFCKVDFKMLTKMANKHLNNNWALYRQPIKFPKEIRLQTENGCQMRLFDDQYAFFEFLRSQDSLSPFHTGEADIYVLATLIKQPITVVSYTHCGFKVGTPLCERSKVKVYKPASSTREARQPQPSLANIIAMATQGGH